MSPIDFARAAVRLNDAELAYLLCMSEEAFAASGGRNYFTEDRLISVSVNQAQLCRHAAIFLAGKAAHERSKAAVSSPVSAPRQLAYRHLQALLDSVSDRSLELILRLVERMAAADAQAKAASETE